MKAGKPGKLESLERAWKGPGKPGKPGTGPAEEWHILHHYHHHQNRSKKAILCCYKHKLKLHSIGGNLAGTLLESLESLESQKA